MAIGALSALREAGVGVPQEMAVAGFDDIAMARYMHPRLSTVRVDIAALGERATDRLLEAVASRRRHKKRREVVPVMLVIRESCGGGGDRSSAISPVRRDASWDAMPSSQAWAARCGSGAAPCARPGRAPAG